MSLCDQCPTRSVAARRVMLPIAPAPHRATVTEPRPRFVGFAWASLLLGIVGVMFSAVPVLNAVTMLGAIVGVVLGGTALFGFRKRLAAIGTVSCALAVVFTVSPATPADQPVGSVPPLAAPHAPVQLPAAPAPPASPTLEMPPVPLTAVPAAAAGRQAVPTSPAEHVKTPAERTPVAAQLVASQPASPHSVTPQPAAPRPVAAEPVAATPVAPQWDYHSSADPADYRNCEAARAAGAAPIEYGEPGYRPALGGDHDGTACDR